MGQSSAIELTREYLQSLMARGVSTAVVNEKARLVLRQWYIAQKGNAPQEPDTAVATTTETPDLNQSLQMIRNLRQETKTPAPVKERLLPANFSFEIRGNTKREKLESLQQIVKNWQPLHKLGTLRDIPVFGQGNPDASIMMIAGAPGMFEEKHGYPLAGKAGVKLDGMLSAMQLKRDDIYLTYLVKYRPAIRGQLSNNRTPSQQELELSLPIIKQEIEIVTPRVIVALGMPVAKALLQTNQMPLYEIRGKFHSIFNIPLMVTHHPSYLLSTDDIAGKRRIWEELLAVMDYLHMPVTPKQRAYFLPKSR